ncbi:MAG: hypothetical protein V4485_06290 [Pseudomonadota bacterium]
MINPFDFQPISETIPARTNTTRRATTSTPTEATLDSAPAVVLVLSKEAMKASETPKQTGVIRSEKLYVQFIVGHIRKNNPASNTLDISHKTLNHYGTYLGHEGLNDNDVRDICEALRSNPHITTLYSNSKYLGDEGVRAIAGVKTLNDVSLHSHNISDEGVKALANSPTLGRVSLYSDSISSKGMRALAASNTLSYASVVGRRIEYSDIIALDNRTKENRRIKHGICQKIVSRQVLDEEQLAFYSQNRRAVAFYMLRGSEFYPYTCTKIAPECFDGNAAMHLEKALESDKRSAAQMV